MLATSRYRLGSTSSFIPYDFSWMQEEMSHFSLQTMPRLKVTLYRSTGMLHRRAASCNQLVSEIPDSVAMAFDCSSGYGPLM